MPTERSLPTTLPTFLYQFFWDTDPTQINPSQNPTHIIHRLLDKGDINAARWVIQTFPKNLIIQTLKQERDFSPWNGTFWSAYVGISQKEVACLEPSYQTWRQKLWPY